MDTKRHWHIIFKKEKPGELVPWVFFIILKAKFSFASSFASNERFIAEKLYHFSQRGWSTKFLSQKN